MHAGEGESGLVDYYRRRAAEYESIYFRDEPVRRTELEEMARDLRALVEGRDVLEVACGTGYWSAIAAGAARSLVGVDAAPEVLEIASAKQMGPAPVRFQLGDAYDLAGIAGVFDAGVACFWLSHVPRRRLDGFLHGFHGRLQQGSKVFVADNVPVPGVGGELVVREGCEDGYKLRTLSDGSRYQVLKNYYSASELEELLSRHGEEVAVHEGRRYWWASYISR